MGTGTAPEQSDIRWLQRFENLERALAQLRAAITAHQAIPEDDLFVIALIKAYEFSFELSWKTLKDLLAWNGVDARLPREVLKQAFATGLLENGQLWIDMLEQRNLMAHTYDQSRARQAAELISHSFWPELNALQRSLADRREQQQQQQGQES
jgi:nucleotidyltransferase substrate binding protein (TIGR01987 family)